MADTLLRVLSNADLDWMIAWGEQQTLAAGQSLWQPHSVPNRVALIIDGSLGESFVASDLAADKTVLIDELGAGEMVGFSRLLERPQVTAITALRTTLVLSLSIDQIKAKLADDIAFAAHFYHAIALMLCDRMRRLFEHPERAQVGGHGSPGSVFDHRVGNDVLTVFGELRDSDVDWLTAFGQIETVAVGQALLRAARPVESLYILLHGQMAVLAYPGRFDPLALCFLSAARGPDRPVCATLSQGSMPGIVSFLDFRPLPIAVQATAESLIFAVPRQTLVTKLQVDDSFASRFYQVIAMQILEQLQTVGLGLGLPGTLAAPGRDEELDMDDLQQVSEGAKKFGWMLAQLGVNHHG